MEDLAALRGRYTSSARDQGTRDYQALDTGGVRGSDEHDLFPYPWTISGGSFEHGPQSARQVLQVPAPLGSP